jgi:hypothetical protein
MSKAKQGAICPCCRQKVQIYEREIHASMARVLIILHRHFLKETDWLHVPSYLETLSRQLGAAIRGGDWAKLRYWALIEEKPKTERKDGSKRVGFWKVTDKGHAFAKNELRIPKAVQLYNDKFLGFVSESVTVSILDCLGKEFSYEELMSGKYVDLVNF